VVLSETELRVAELAAAGLAVETIAEALGVPPDVAAGQLRAVYRKLGPGNPDTAKAREGHLEGDYVPQGGLHGPG